MVVRFDLLDATLRLALGVVGIQFLLRLALLLEDDVLLFRTGNGVEQVRVPALPPRPELGLHNEIGQEISDVHPRCRPWVEDAVAKRVVRSARCRRVRVVEVARAHSAEFDVRVAVLSLIHISEPTRPY